MTLAAFGSAVVGQFGIGYGMTGAPCASVPPTLLPIFTAVPSCTTSYTLYAPFLPVQHHAAASLAGRLDWA